jgi:hypothetical protein
VELDRDGSNGDEGVVVFTASEDTTPRLFARGAGLLRVLDFSNDAKSLWCDVANANRLLNIDMQTGALDQIQYANFEPSSQPTIARINEDDSGIVIFSATGIKEISVKSGQKTVWQREAIGDAVWAPATRSVGKEVAVEYDRSHHTLFAISLQTGKDLWQKSGFVDIANIRAGSSDGAFLAVVRDGTVKIIPTMGEGEVTAEGISDQYECRFCSDSAYLICIPRMVPQPEPGGAIYIKRQSNVMKVINSKSGKLACTVNPN